MSRLITTIAITKKDLERETEKPIDILTPDKLIKLPARYGVHGTTAVSAAELIKSGKLDRKMALEFGGYYPKGTDHLNGFYLYFASGRLFDLARGWQERVLSKTLRENVVISAGEGFHYAQATLNVQMSKSCFDSGLGVVVFSVSPRGAELLLDDPHETISHPTYGPFPKYVPFHNFSRFHFNVLGAVVTDQEINEILAKAPLDSENEIAFFERVIDIKKLGQVFTQNIVDILSTSFL